ncbi:iron-containing alcohol dehydrogenase [Cellulosilyticum lentocellum]|uniref:Alcohol dehydrogenase (NADP(+)) n=1 Tax=Cellulosilyticum lentocellum (strain ATCC 49066 / DSM 5427 / NCIMB 11756 / RHM5) TaxID=642492 RepID=F2JPX8_CELLD|nr:iron-containing alcohol dehydrogenase [Cellulosilyticum lentocellum]ADZ84913.1 Alcohol dehydrogenase (NADP(+)) [Cellulosilyticum lentocellum DSM 5427]
MDNFIFNAYTKIYFGKGMIKNLPEAIEVHGKNVLLVYGGGSIKRNGIYDEVKTLLSECKIIELSGVDPNPRIETVREGVRLCKEHQIDVILAAGGGSVIDCAKVIGAGYYYDGDAWDLVVEPNKITKVLPIVTILTLAATGSEMNKNAVISNMAINEKLGTGSMNMIPQASILDPEYLYTLPAIQTAAGTADIMSHIFENYFKKEEDTFIQNKLAEGLLETCIKYCPIALKEPENYEARANLMWASTLALNGLVGAGKPGSWTCHPIEHELSAFYDITHGIGLAIVTPRWMRHILNEQTVGKFVAYAKNVWHLPEMTDPFAYANAAIDATEEFFKNCGIPMTFSEIGINEEHFEVMAEKAVRIGGLGEAYVPLTKEDVMSILNMCL